MHIVLLLNYRFVFPYSLQHFPLSEYIYAWLAQNRLNRLTIITGTRIIPNNDFLSQINIVYIESPLNHSSFFSNIFYTKKIINKINSVNPSWVVYDSIDTRMHLMKFNLWNIFPIKRRAKVLIQTYNRCNKTDEVYLKENTVKLPDLPDRLFKATDEKIKSSIKLSITNDSEYFICTAVFHQPEGLIFLLKAFTVLKKRLHSGIKLVLTGIHPESHLHLINLLSSYRHKSDVVIYQPNHEADYISLLGASYGHIFLAGELTFPFGIWETVQCGIPLIMPDSYFEADEMKSLFLLYNDHSIEDLADKMMLLYKDEILRKRMIVESLQRLSAELLQQDFAGLLSGILNK
ncbi:MAG: glycosyltransferase [Bacteroidota bacterium]